MVNDVDLITSATLTIVITKVVNGVRLLISVNTALIIILEIYRRVELRFVMLEIVITCI